MATSFGITRATRAKNAFGFSVACLTRYACPPASCRAPSTMALTSRLMRFSEPLGRPGPGKPDPIRRAFSSDSITALTPRIYRRPSPRHMPTSCFYSRVPASDPPPGGPARLVRGGATQRRVVRRCIILGTDFPATVASLLKAYAAPNHAPAAGQRRSISTAAATTTRARLRQGQAQGLGGNIGGN